MSECCQCLSLGRQDGYPFQWSIFWFWGRVEIYTPGRQARNSVLSGFQLQEQQRGRVPDSDGGSGRSAPRRGSQVPVDDDSSAGRFRIGPGVTDGSCLLVWKDQVCVPFHLWPHLYHRGAQTVVHRATWNADPGLGMMLSWVESACRWAAG